MPNGPAALAIEGMSKTFGATKALDSLDLRVEAGEIRALIGRNGSGKSTLVKILSGYHAPDQGRGRLKVGGRPLGLPASPRAARAAGLCFVQQDLALAPELTVRENVRVGNYGHALMPISRRAEAAAVDRVLERVGMPVERRDHPVAELLSVDRTLVAIARALLAQERAGSGVLVLDEPTSQLASEHCLQLFAAMRAAAESGAGVVFVTHRLAEVLEVCDTVSVLRDGRLVADLKTTEVNQQRLVELMLGRSLDELYPAPGEAGSVDAVTITGLVGQSVRGLDLEIHAGEIVGLTGLPGMGHDEVPYLLFGAIPASAGTVAIRGADPLRLNSLSPPKAMAAGMALLPADRRGASGVAEFTVAENVTLPTISRFIRAGMIDSRAERRHVGAALLRLGVAPPNPNAILGSLSGGNQQKALLGKWLDTEPVLLILHEPTQGVDIGARHDLFRQIEQIAAEGCSVLMVSSEQAALAHVCHRVCVMGHGRIGYELSGAQLNEDRLVAQSYAAESAVA